MTTDADLQTIAAFVDGERVDAAELDRALADPAGRAYLIDLAALREVVGVRSLAAVTSRTASPLWRRWVAAAAIVLSLAGGFMAGRGTSDAGPAMVAVTGPGPGPATSPAPAPTRVIELPPGYQHIPKGAH